MEERDDSIEDAENRVRRRIFRRQRKRASMPIPREESSAGWMMNIWFQVAAIQQLERFIFREYASDLWSRLNDSARSDV